MKILPVQNNKKKINFKGYNQEVEIITAQIKKGMADYNEKSPVQLIGKISGDGLTHDLPKESLSKYALFLNKFYKRLVEQKSPLVKNNRAMISFVNQIVDLGNIANNQNDKITARNCYTYARTLGVNFNIHKITRIEPEFFKGLDRALKSLS